MTRPMLFPLLAIAIGAAIVAFAGCSGEAGDTTTLDSVLTRTESLVDLEQDREARQFLHGQLDSRNDIRQGKATAAGWRMLAELYAAAALYDSAHSAYDRAADAYRGLAQRDHAYEMAIAAGELDIRSGRPARARIQYEEALRLALVFGDSASAGMVRLALIPVYAVLEDRGAERDALTKLYATARAHQDRAMEARIAFADGLASAGRSDNDEAAATFLRAVTLADGAGDSLLATQALLQVAVTLDHAGQTREALTSFGSALARPSLLRYHTSLALELLVRTGNVYLRTKDPAQAKRFYQSAVRIANASHNALLEAYLMMQLGHAELATDRATAIQSFRAGYDQFRSFHYAPGTTYALTTLAAIAEQENRSADALQLYTAAMAEQERCLALPAATSLYRDCERSGARNPGEDAAQGLVALLLQLARPDEAFTAQQRRNGRALMLRLSPGVFRTGGAEVDTVLAVLANEQASHRGAEYQQEVVLSSASNHRTVREDILAAMERARGSISEATEDIARLAPAFLPLATLSTEKPSDVQKRVPEGSAFLTFIPGRRSVSVAVVTPAGSAVRMSVHPPEKVTRAIDDYLALLRAQTTSGADAGKPAPAQGIELQTLTRTLYEALVLPVEPMLKPGTRLFVQFPEGMPPFPLHALRRAPLPGTPFLAERYPIQYLTTPAFPPAASHRGTVPSAVTCAGFAGTSGWDVEYELRDIRFFFKDARMLFAQEATLDTLRNVRADVLHLAVDMQFGVHSPLAGRFLLSDGESRDGSRVIPLSTLTQLHPARIVVVSSLTAGRPSFDALVPFALGANGSGTCVMNIFLPTRGAKKAFAEFFYTALLQGVPADEALQKAQVAMIRGKEFSTPAAWGAFMAWSMN
jgi:CHAT domain-containing protein/tetratricopeptide (TPR) repeat protein